MLDWPWWRYKFTLGVGALAMTGMMADLWQKVLPFWAIAAVTLLPICVFLFVKAGEMPARFVRAAHVAAAGWYVISAAAVMALWFPTATRPADQMLYVTFVAIGLIPCALVITRAMRGRYGDANDGSGGSGGMTQ